MHDKSFFSYSSISSGENAVAVNVLKDIIQPIYRKWTDKDMTDKMSLVVAKMGCKYIIEID